MTITDLHREVEEIKGKMRDILETADKEKKDVTAEEEKTFLALEKSFKVVERKVNAWNFQDDKPVKTFTPPMLKTGGELSDRTAYFIGANYWTIFASANFTGKTTAEEFLRGVVYNTPERRTMVEGSGTLGGYSVPDQWAAEIWDAAIEQSILLGRCRVYPLKTDTLHIPCWDSSDHSAGPVGDVESSWLGEAATASAVTPVLRLVTLIPKKLGMYVHTSCEVSEDSLSLNNQLGPMLTRSLNFTIDDSLINGDGVAKPLGFLNAGATISVGRATAGAINYTDVMNLYQRILPVFLSEPIWIASPAAMGQLLAMTDGGSHYIFPASLTGVSQAVPATLLGRPLLISEKAPTL